MGTKPINALTSILCLSAALSVQRGEKGPITIEAATLSGEPISDAERTFLEEQAAEAVKLFEKGSPDELAAAIELYRAHLKLCGYDAEWGTTN
jgi:hypothetical protein